MVAAWREKPRQLRSALDTIAAMPWSGARFIEQFGYAQLGGKYQSVRRWFEEVETAQRVRYLPSIPAEQELPELPGATESVSTPEVPKGSGTRKEERRCPHCDGEGCEWCDESQRYTSNRVEIVSEVTPSRVHDIEAKGMT